MEFLFLGTATAVIVGSIYWCYFRTPEEEQLTISIPTISIPAHKNKNNSHKNSGGIPISILFYSQTGTSEDFSQRLSEDLSSFGFSPETMDVENYEKEDLKNEKLVIFLASTYGEGDPPDNASEFHKWLVSSERSEENYHFNYAVFGLGNKTYDKFNQVGKDIDSTLERLGCKRLFPLGLGDDDVNIEKDFLSWKKEISAVLCKEYSLDTPLRCPSNLGTCRQKLVTYQPEDDILKGVDINVISRWRPQEEKPRSTPDQKNPYLAQILLTRELHTTESDRSCLHVEISTHGDVLSYLPGDHLGLYPENDPTQVHKLAALLKADINTIVSVHTNDDKSGNNIIVGPCTLKAALSQYYDITSIVRKPQLRVLAQYAKDEEEKKQIMKLSSEDPELQEVYDTWMIDCKCISEVLKEFKSVEVPLDHFLEVLPKMQPRYYSISSSPTKNPDTVHLTAVLVDYVTPTKRHAQGVTTHWLSTHRANPEKGIFPRIPAFIRRSNFKLPSSLSTPIIMVGPGTGLAPFRGFIQECSARRANNTDLKLGELILFFGCRHPDKDYIYREELEGFVADGTLSALMVAFSRIEEKKVSRLAEEKNAYVQHKMKEGDMPDRLWKLLESGAHFYICGDARRMARDVSETLLNIIMEKGSRSRQEAQKYVDDLQSSQRYLSDVWS